MQKTGLSIIYFIVDRILIIIITIYYSLGRGGQASSRPAGRCYKYLIARRLSMETVKNTSEIVKELSFCEAFSLLLALRELKTSPSQGRALQDASQSQNQQDLAQA